MIHIFIFVCCLAGFFCLAAAMTRHQQELLKRKLPDMWNRPLSWAGYLVLSLAFILSIVAFGGATAPVIWLGHSTIAALIIVGFLTYKANAKPVKSAPLRNKPSQ